MGFNKQPDEEEKETDEISTAQLIALAEQQGGIDLRTFGLCGDIDEESGTKSYNASARRRVFHSAADSVQCKGVRGRP